MRTSSLGVKQTKFLADAGYDDSPFSSQLEFERQGTPAAQRQAFMSKRLCGEHSWVNSIGGESLELRCLQVYALQEAVKRIRGGG